MNFEEILSYAITGEIDSIKFIQCHIGKINAFAINSQHSIYEISFEKCQIDSIESQSFKKINIDHLRIENTTIHAPIPARSFYDLIISDTFSITKSTLTAITSSAFVLRGKMCFFFSFKIHYVY